MTHGLVADPLFCDLLANLHLHLEHEVDAERVVDIRRTISAAAISVVDAIEPAVPALGRSGAFDIVIAAYSLAAAFWQIANPPRAARRRLRQGAGSAATGMEHRFRLRAHPLLTATCIGLGAGSP